MPALDYKMSSYFLYDNITPWMYIHLQMHMNNGIHNINNLNWILDFWSIYYIGYKYFTLCVTPIKHLFLDPYR